MSAAPMRLALLALVSLGAACVAPSAEPTEPVLGTVDSPTSVDVLHLRGTKQAATGVEVQLSSGGNPRDPVIVDISDATQWAVDVQLLEGDNTLTLSALDGAGRRSPTVTLVVVLDTEAPDAPEGVALPPFTARALVDVAGSVSPGDDVVINGVRAAVGGGDFTEEVALALGGNRVRLVARDIAGNESDVLDFVVQRVAAVPFELLDPPPDVVTVVNAAFVTLSGTRGEGVEVVVNGVVALPANTPLGVDGAWSVDVDVAQGANALEVVGRFPGEDETAVVANLQVTVDSIFPGAPDVDPLPPFTARTFVDVTGAVTPNSDEDVVVNGVVSAPDDAVTGAFSVRVEPLLLGDNTITVSASDAAGNENAAPVVQTITRVADVPFSVNAPPPLVGGDDVPFSLTGTRGEGVEVEVVGAGVVVPASTPLGIGTWSAVVALVDGLNDFTVIGRFPGELDTQRVDKTLVDADLSAPAVVVQTPVAGDLAGNVLVVDGTATDDNDAAVRVCVGLPREVDPAACIDDVDYADSAFTGDDFTIAFDLSSNAALSDGDPGTVYVRAEDTLGNVAEITRDVLVFRAPLVVAEAVGVVNRVDLVRPSSAPVGGSAATVSGALVWSNNNGDAGLALDEAEGPTADDVAWRPTAFALALGAATATDVHVASNAGAVHAVWIDSGDLMYAQAGGGSIEVVDGAVNPVTSVDVAFDEDAGAAGNEAVLAFVQSGLVRTTVSTTFGGTITFSTPATVSDGVTAAPTDVTVAAGGVALAWVETSARDGTLDDDDVVLVARTGGVASAPVLVSVSQGSFVDDASARPHLATLANGDVAIAWLEAAGTPSARGVATLVDVDALPTPTVPPPVDVTEVAGSGAASDVLVEADGNIMLFAWLDDGATLLDGAAAPALVVRRAATLAALGAPVVLPSDAAASPTGFLDGAFATLAWVEGGDALLYVVEVP